MLIVTNDKIRTISGIIALMLFLFSGMAPNSEDNIRLQEGDYEQVAMVAPQAAPREYTIVYSMVLTLVYWHIGLLYGLYLAFTSARWETIIFNLLIFVAKGFGVTAGAHRLWAHRAYKAKLPLQILLMLLQTLSHQNTVFNWVRDHRLHHKYCDTDTDPHNSTRGFFYSHIGWLMVQKHPDAIKRGKTIDMSDLMDNPVLQFQKKYYFILNALLVFILPLLIPVYCWQETLSNSHYVFLVGLVLGSHIFFSINSVAHMFGNKSYDKSITSTQNLFLSFFAFGEGYHNYHHVFPFDYRVSELGNNYLNFSTKFIDLFAWIGWAYDLKHASDDIIDKRTKRTGDGTDLWGRLKEDTETERISSNVPEWSGDDILEEKKMFQCHNKQINNNIGRSVQKIRKHD